MSAPNPVSAPAESKEYVPPDAHRLHAAYSHKTLQAFHNDAPLLKQHVVYPIFVTTDPDAKEAIKALPNQYRWGVNRLEEFLGPLVQRGLKSVIIFGVVGEQHAKVKDACGSFGTDPSSPVAAALRLLAAKYPDLLLMCDVCLCGYTDHGHCGIVDDKGRIDNQKSITRLSELAVFYAENGAHVVAPSDMMDGRIGAIKHALKQRGGTLFDRVAVMSYAAKFASCLYGPFREAAASGMKFGDRTLYQLPPHARGLALRAVERDLEEGADMVMVKPGGFYLDLVRETKDLSRVPVAVYQVSGEYAMLYHAAAAGCFDLRTGVLESLVAMRRAGADMILTYYAPELIEWL